jgi:cellulose biosynthesis protein BcsQ
MSSYAFWNNKGGVGKSFLCFVAACEYANRNPGSDVYVLDLCPQANVSEMLLGGGSTSAKHLKEAVTRKPRATVAGYFEARLNSPFVMVSKVDLYILKPRTANSGIPPNLYLICGDNLLEVLSEAIRQTSQLAVPVDAWKQVIYWLRDLVNALRARSGDRDSLFAIDCNPSFAIYTQLALAAADSVVVPFTADDSSRRGIENVIALLFGVGDEHITPYARINFAKRAKEEGVELPRLHTFVSNRVTLYRGRASSAFEAVSRTIKKTLDALHSKHRSLFANPKELPSKSFIEVPDYHSACIVASTSGTPIHKIRAGPWDVAGERVQLNPEPLQKYKDALDQFVDCL